MNGASSSLQQLRFSLFLIASILIAGTIGFYVLSEGRGVFECFYLTVMIITTVGLKEQYTRFNPSEGVWSLIVMLLGIIITLYAASNLVAFLIGGELKQILGRRQLQEKINQLSNHFIVCGFGRMGRALCDALSQKSALFVVIDNNPERTQMADERSYLHILADATLEQTLELAQISNARALASCLKRDADNVLVTLSARGMNPNLTITARAEEMETQHKLERAGASRVICPPVLGATRIMQMMLHPAVEELMDVAVSGEELEISKVKAEELPHAVGHSLSDLRIPAKTGLTVVAVIHADGRRRFNPPPGFQIEEQDELIVIGPPRGVDALLQEWGD